MPASSVPQRKQNQVAFARSIGQVLAARRQRATFHDRIHNPKSQADLWDALRGFYELALPKILAAPRHKWALEPYEVEWTKLFSRIELALWQEIRSEGVVLYPQFPVDRYFVDFANPVARVVIECDGAMYHQDVERDLARERVIRDNGWHVYRITGRDCLSTKEVEEWDGQSTPNMDALKMFIRDFATWHRIAPWALRDPELFRPHKDRGDEISDEFADG